MITADKTKTTKRRVKNDVPEIRSNDINLLDLPSIFSDESNEKDLQEKKAGTANPSDSDSDSGNLPIPKRMEVEQQKSSGVIDSDSDSSIDEMLKKDDNLMPLKKITDEKLKTVGLSNIDAVHSLEMTPKTGSKRKRNLLNSKNAGVVKPRSLNDTDLSDSDISTKPMQKRDDNLTPVKKITKEMMIKAGLSNVDAVHSSNNTPKTGSKRKKNMPTQNLKVMESRSLSDTDSDSDISTKLMRKKYENKLKSSAVNDVKAGCSKDITPKNDNRRKSSDFPSSKKNKGNIPKSPDCTKYESNISCVLTKRDGKKEVNLTPFKKANQNKTKSIVLNDVRAGCSKDITPKNDSTRKRKSLSPKKVRENISQSQDTTDSEIDIPIGVTPKKDHKSKKLHLSSSPIDNNKSETTINTDSSLDASTKITPRKDFQLTNKKHIASDMELYEEFLRFKEFKEKKSMVQHEP
ncbi:GSCOCG00010908001-RA-CDS [Cotesia congregata]|uniref:Uncharacterized protein n=1 Tax=Cotesia congregata TaxID=51543 RepID=A0A8J2HAN3_COTCN|nr:GSCOCG00010908001-RA-CDS [Cotesia congregata]CAG5090275.1 Protein of unknown function [Cotesia congregata]